MLPVQFFLFGLFLAWFTGTGKLRKLLEALRKDPPSSSGDGTTTTPGTSPFPGGDPGQATPNPLD